MRLRRAAETLVCIAILINLCSWISLVWRGTGLPVFVASLLVMIGVGICLKIIESHG